MELRYIAGDGTEKCVDGLPELIEAVHKGEIGPETLVFSLETGRWIRAGGMVPIGAVLPAQAVATNAEDVCELKTAKDMPKVSSGWAGPAGSGSENSIANLPKLVSCDEQPRWSYSLRLSMALIAVGPLLPFLSALVFVKHFENPTMYLSGAFGAAMGVCLAGTLLAFVFVSIPLRLLFGKRNHRVLFTFAVTFFAVCLARSAYDLYWGEQALRTANALKAIASDVRGATSNSAVVERRDLTHEGPLGPYLDLLNQMMVEGQQLSVVTRQEMNGIQAREPLKAENLATPEGISRAKNVLEQMLALVLRWEGEYYRLLDKMQEQYQHVIDQCAIEDKPEREEALVALESGIIASKEQFAKLIAVERAFVAESEKRVEFFERLNGRFSVEGERILFPSTEEAAEHNAQLTKILQLAAEEAEMLSEFQRAALQTAEGIDRLSVGLPPEKLSRTQ